jgi:TP901 family phage tail tape measure protein
MSIYSGSENLAIGIGLYMRDGFTANAGRASVALNNLRNNADALARQQATNVRNMNAMGAAAGGLLLQGVGKAYQEFASFNYLMKFTALAADNSTKALDGLSNKALEVGKRTIFSSKEVAEGMRWLAQAGLASNEIISTIDTAANLAASTQSPLGGQNGAADLLARITTAFMIPKTDSNMAMVGDVLAYGANKSLTDLTQFGEGMTYAQTTAMRLKMTLEETTAAIMMLSNAGIRGTVTGTTLDNMARYLADTAGGRRRKATKALASIGLSPQDLQDAQGNLKPMATLLDMIGSRVQNLGTVAKNNIAIDIFGVRGAKGTSLMDNLPKYIEFLRELQNNQGYSGKIANELMDSDQGQIDRLKSNWESLKIEFGATVAPLLRPLLSAATKVLDIIGMIINSPVGKFITPLLTLFLMLKTAQMGYNAILLSIRLAQTTLGTSMVTSAGLATTSYGRMTAAATAYSAVLTRLRMMGTASMGVGSIGQFRSGQYYQVGPGGGYIPLARGSYKPGLAKGNAFMGKAMLPMMLGGMLLNAGSEAAGGNATSSGRAMGVAGDTLGFAGTGALVGSIIPGVGTLVGGIVGGIGGLMYSLHSRLSDLKGVVDEATTNAPEFNMEKWRSDVAFYNALKYKDVKYNMSGTQVLTDKGRAVRGGRDNDPNPTNIIINIDGKKMMDKKYNDNSIKEMIDLGLE